MKNIIPVKYVVLLVSLLVTQGCLANEKKKTPSPAPDKRLLEKHTPEKQLPQKPVSTKQLPQKHVPQARSEIYKTSPYTPSELLLNLDFEDERVKSVKKKNKSYDLLEIQTPTGLTTSLGIMYENGSDSDRHARIVADPENKDNKVFHFWLKNALIPDQKKGKFKGRIQMNLSDVNKTSFFQRYRLYLHPDLDLYRQFPNLNSWFGLSTMWMGAAWEGHKYPFKISLNIGKPKGVGKPLYFVAGASLYDGGPAKRSRWKDLWVETAANFEVPTGEWIDVEIGYKAGNKKTGRFYMAVKREHQKEFTTLFDVTDWTYHPRSPKPVAVSHLQPLKMYSSSRIFDFIRKKGGVAQLYYDDFEVYENW